MVSYLHRYPYIRLVIPWIAGVFCGDRFFNGSLELFWGILAFCFLAGLSIGCYFLGRYSLRWCFGIAILALCFTGGWVGITWQLQHATGYTFPKEETVYRGWVTDTPETKEHTFLCRVLLKEQRDSTAIHSIDDCKAILYLQRDSAAAGLKRGDELWVSARISPPVNGRNFDEFDYARYLMRKGISGTGYVVSGKWMLASSEMLSSGNGNIARKSTLLEVAGSCRDRILSLYRQLGFEGDGLAVLSALTVGDKTELSDSVRESYSVAGASHVLALSGLHIGLLYALLFFILSPVAKRGNAGRCLRAVFLLILLWAFAFFTGLSPSVVRSACMFSIWAVADIFNRQALSLNTLAATAGVMLLCNPVWLFDVGFQLSFLAVASILLTYKPIYRLLPVKSRIGRYFWGLMSVSIAAQLGTAPLVMFYFSRFSTHFLFTNLVVIPLVTIILYSAVVMLLLTPLHWIQNFIAEGVKFLLDALNTFIHWVEQLPYASIDGIWLYQLEVLGLYLSGGLVFYYFANRGLKNLLICLFSILLLGVYHVSMSWVDRPLDSIVFYNVRGCPAVHCIDNNGNSRIVYGDSLSDKRQLYRVATNYWNHHQLLSPLEVTADYQDTALCCREQILSYHGRRICMVTDHRWRNKSAATPLYIDYLYLCKGYNGHLKELRLLFAPECIILDASLSEHRKQLFEEECKQSGLRFISLSEKGSVRFLL